MIQNNKVKITIGVKKTRDGYETKIRAHGYGNLDMLINGAVNYICSIINNAIKEIDTSDGFADVLKDFILEDICKKVNDKF